MKFLRVGNIWFMWVLWTVYVRGTLYQTSYRCKKQDGKNEEQPEPLFSVLENSLASCAVICWPDTYCRYIVYNRHNRLCHGYGDDVCDDDGSDKTSGDVVYQQMCKKRCLKENATYKLTFKTGKERYTASKADLTVAINGPCGHVGTAIKNGKDIKLRRGRKSTFRVKVEHEEMATGDEVSTKFKTNYRLSANVDNKQLESRVSTCLGHCSGHLPVLNACLFRYANIEDTHAFSINSHSFVQTEPIQLSWDSIHCLGTFVTKSV